MKKTTTKVTVESFCDNCGQPCSADNKKRKVYWGGTSDYSNYVNVRISYDSPYCTTDGDLCTNCALLALKKIVEEMEKEIVQNFRN
jgi:uncharacterized cysteine cluster protein YcgN (CxxCxxCC family)